MKQTKSLISAAFPYHSLYADVDGVKMHYIDEGSGDPIVFLHGVPTSSYLWRNIIPHLSSHARCIAVDLVGFGKSDKPDIDYTVFDHIHYFQGFLEKLNLRNITLVLHGWGSVIGFDYAMRHENQMKGLAFYESYLRLPKANDMPSLPLHELLSVLSSEDGGYDAIMNKNYYVKTVLVNAVIRKLSDEEMAWYESPFKQAGSCKPIWQFLQEYPLLQDEKTKVSELINAYSEKLTQSRLPKLMLYGVPGLVTTIDTVQWAREHLKNLTLIEIEDALHYAQESYPEIVGKNLLDWYLTLPSAKP